MKKHEERWLLIGTDQRIALCSQLLQDAGYETTHSKTNEVTDELNAIIRQLQPTHIVCPILQLKGHFSLVDLPSTTRLFTGVATPDWKTYYMDAGHVVHSYMEDEQFIWENARLTAEGFLKEFYEETSQAVYGKKIVIAGFGRVGKMMARSFAALGASITVLARSEEQRSEAHAFGYEAQNLTVSNLPIDSFLINTIPVRWLDDQRPPIRLFDVSSYPGCLREGASTEYYTLHLGLPGKHFPSDAAKALCTALQRIKGRS